MKNISNKAIVLGIVGLVIGLILGWFMGKSQVNVANDRKDVKVKEISVNDNVDLSNTDKPSNALLVNSQPSEESESAILVVDQVAGNVVNIASVETDVSAWVVVREDMKGIVGNILGASRIDSGNSNNIVVDLLRPTVAGGTYQVVLFKDDGDRIFDHKIDAPLTSDGVLISKPFMTTVAK